MPLVLLILINTENVNDARFNTIKSCSGNKLF
jgi:hypothetical protein